MAKDRKLYLNERTTIRDVAQEAGVSLTTVSHALNGYKDVSEKTRQKVMEVARRLDYMPDADKQADKNQFWADLQEKETDWNHS